MLSQYEKDKFKAKFASLKESITDFINGGKKNPRGYAQLSGLNDSLLGGDRDNTPNYGYGFAGGAPHPTQSQGQQFMGAQPMTAGAGSYQQPGANPYAAPAPRQEAPREQMPPSLNEELSTTAHLSNEAATLLFEAISMIRGPGPVDNEVASNSVELLENCEMLEKQLRGLIGDAMTQGLSDESLLGGALAALDALQNVKTEYFTAVGGGAAPQAQPQAAPAPEVDLLGGPVFSAPAFGLVETPKNLSVTGAPAPAAVPASILPTPQPQLSAMDKPLIDF